MTLIYTLLIHLFYASMLMLSVFNRKASQWIRGRKNWSLKLKQHQKTEFPVYWFHAASLGEFEQGRPLIESMKKQIPGCTVILTFFSPSGYEIRKNYEMADVILYLPLDTDYNARKFIDQVKPDAVFFIKYEFWYFYLRHLQRKNIPVFLVSGIFRQNHIFFRWYGTWFRKQLKYFRHFFLQDNNSAKLLKDYGLSNVTVTGDTRFDRVISNATSAHNIPAAAAFSEYSFCIVAGSTWPADEMLLARFMNESLYRVKLIIAPHEIDPPHIQRLVSLFREEPAVYSTVHDDISQRRVLIIDNIGMLSSLYRYGSIAYIGGGFGKGIHNVLEAAVYGIPVIFGPNYSRFREAVEMIRSGAAFTASDFEEMVAALNRLTASAGFREIAAMKAREYVYSNAGSTEKIMKTLDAVLPP